MQNEAVNKAINMF